MEALNASERTTFLPKRRLLQSADYSVITFRYILTHIRTNCSSDVRNNFRTLLRNYQIQLKQNYGTNVHNYFIMKPLLQIRNVNFFLQPTVAELLALYLVSS